jgi:outer membrane autotransporter protein
VAPSGAATYALTYPNANDEVLHYVINFDPTGLTPTQASVGAAINQIQTARVSSFSATAAKIFSAPDVGSLGRLYDLIGGQGVTATQTSDFAAVGSFEQSLSSQTDLRGRFDEGGLAQSDRDPLWIQVIGGRARIDGVASEGSATVSNRSGGIAVGWDFSPTPKSILGVAIEGVSSRFSVGALDTYGKVSTVSIAAYGAVTEGPWSERFDLAYGRHHNSYNRLMMVPGVSETGHGAFNGQSYSGYAEVSRTFRPAPDTKLTPFAAIGVTGLALDSYAETSTAAGGAPGVLGLRFDSRNYTRTQTYLGVDASTAMAVSQDMVLRPSLRASWVHDYDPTRSAQSSFLSAPGYTFDQHGAPGIGDGARLDGRIMLNTKTYDLQLRAGALVSSRYDGLDAEFGVKVRW